MGREVRGEILGYRYIYREPLRGERVLLLLHGTGGGEEDLVPLARAVDPEAGILSPRGKVLENGMPRFFRRLAPGVYDLEDLRHRAEELGDFIDIASREHGFSARKLVAIGYSNGANMAAAILLLRPGSVGGAALLRPYFPVDPIDLGSRPGLGGKPILILAGRRDPIAPLESSLGLEKMLKSLGAEALLELVEAGHELARRDVEILREWLPRAFQGVERSCWRPDLEGLSQLY